MPDGEQRNLEELSSESPTLLPNSLLSQDIYSTLVGVQPTLPPPSTPQPTVLETASSINEKVRYFGDYELLSEIARGGMGVVYKARQVNLNRLVALKMILAGLLASEEEVKRFHMEAEAAAALDHPGIVPIFEIGVQSDQHFFSMGLVEGGSLADKLKDGPLTSREAARYTKKVAEAIAYAHSKGVIHRDLKPANVLLDHNGEPKVTDFGLARRTESNSDLTRTGAVMGTPSYMSPEQAAGKTSQVGPLSDIYSLGAILYCLLTGRPPFQAANPLDTVIQVIEKDPISPRELVPSVAKDLETICLKCLHKEPMRRYASCDAFVEDIVRFLGGLPILARPVGPVERSIRWVNRHKTITALASVAGASLLLGTVISLWFAYQSNIKANEAEREKVIAQGAQREASKNLTFARRESERAAAELSRSEGLVYSRTLALAQIAIEQENAGEANRYLSQTQGNRRGWEYSMLWSRANSLLTIQAHSGKVVSQVAFSRDGSLLGSCDGSSPMKFWHPKTGDLLFQLNPSDFFSKEAGNTLAAPVTTLGMYFMPDQENLFTYNSNRTLTLWSLATRKITKSFSGFAEQIVGFAISHDGNLVAAVSGYPEHKLKVWSVDSEEVINESEKVECMGGLTFIGNRDQLAITTQNELTVIGLLDGKRKTLVSNINDIIWGVQYSSSSNCLITIHERKLKFRDPETGTVKYELDDSISHIDSIAFCPAGNVFATAGGEYSTIEDGRITLWNLENNQRIDSLIGHDQRVSSVDISPDGQLLASGCCDGTVKIWDTQRGTNRSIVLREVRVGSPMRLSPDGKLLASIAQSNSKDAAGNNLDAIKIWNVDHHTVIYSHDFDARRVIVDDLCFSPDGSRLLFVSRENESLSIFVNQDGSMRSSTEKLPRAVVKEWNLQTNTVRILFQTDDEMIASMDWCRDGAHVITGTRNILDPKVPGVIRIWDYHTQQLIATSRAQESGITMVRFSPTDKLFASGNFDGTIKTWNLEGCRELRTWRGHSAGLMALAFSGDGKMIATGGGYPTDRKTAEDVCVWNVHGGELVAKLSGHMRSVYSVAFSPGGDRLASGGLDETVRLWDFRRGVEVLVLRTHKKNVSNLAFSPDGQRLYSQGWEGTVQMLKSSTQADFNTAESHADQ